MSGFATCETHRRTPDSAGRAVAEAIRNGLNVLKPMTTERLLLPSGKTVTIQKATPSFTTPWKSKVGGVFGLTRTETASAKTIGTPNGCGNCRKPTRKLCSIKSVRRETADAQERGTFSVGAMASIFSLNRNGSGTTNFGDPSLSGWKLRLVSAYPWTHS